MENKSRVQIVAYVSPDLKAIIEQERKSAGHRVSMSAYIEGVLRRHCDHNKKKSAA